MKINFRTVIFPVFKFDVLDEESKILIGIGLGYCEVTVASILFFSCGCGSK